MLLNLKDFGYFSWQITDDDGDEVVVGNRLNFTAYAKATLPTNPVNIALSADGPTSAAAAGLAGVSLVDMGGHSATFSAPTASSGLTLGKNVNQVWGKKPDPVPTPPAPSPSQAAAASQPQLQPQSPQVAFSAAPVHAAASASPPEPAAPRAPTEKEKMAAALFGGVAGGSSSGSKHAPRRTSATSNSPAYSAPAPPPPTPAAGNTMDRHGGQATSSAADNLLDMLSMDSEPSSSSNSAAMDLLADLSGPAMSPAGPAALSSRPVPTPQAPAAASSVFDAFDDLLSPTPVASSQTKTGGISGIATGYSTDGCTLRPLALKTSEFGARWSSTPCELKQGTACRVRSLAQLRAAVENRWGTPFIGHVESIQNTNEVVIGMLIFSVHL